MLVRDEKAARVELAELVNIGALSVEGNSYTITEDGKIEIILRHLKGLIRAGVNAITSSEERNASWIQSALVPKVEKLAGAMSSDAQVAQILSRLDEWVGKSYADSDAAVKGQVKNIQDKIVEIISQYKDAAKRKGRGRPATPGKSPDDALVIIANHLLNEATEGTLTADIYLDEGYVGIGIMPNYKRYKFEAPAKNRDSALRTARRDLRGLIGRGMLEIVPDIKGKNGADLYRLTEKGKEEIGNIMLPIAIKTAARERAGKDARPRIVFLRSDIGDKKAIAERFLGESKYAGTKTIMIHTGKFKLEPNSYLAREFVHAFYDGKGFALVDVNCKDRDLGPLEMSINGQKQEVDLSSLDVIAYNCGVLIVTQARSKDEPFVAFRVKGDRFVGIPKEVVLKHVRGALIKEWDGQGFDSWVNSDGSLTLHGAFTPQTASPSYRMAKFYMGKIAEDFPMPESLEQPAVVKEEDLHSGTGGSESSAGDTEGRFIAPGKRSNGMVDSAVILLKASDHQRLTELFMEQRRAIEQIKTVHGAGSQELRAAGLLLIEMAEAVSIPDLTSERKAFAEWLNGDLDRKDARDFIALWVDDIKEPGKVSEPEADTQPQANSSVTEFLPNAYTIATNNIGSIQAGTTPEIIKYFMRNKMPVPEYYIVPPESVIDGVNYADFEFPMYFNYFVNQGRKIKIIGTNDQIERVKVYLGESLFGPSDEDMRASGLSEDQIGEFRREFDYFNKDQKAGKLKTLSDFVEFIALDDSGKVNINGVSVAVSGNGVSVDEDGKRLASVEFRESVSVAGESVTFPEKPFINPEFGYTFLGTSTGFDPVGRPTSFIQWWGQKGMLVDPLVYSSKHLDSLGIEPDDVQDVFLSHVHSDHDAGLLEMILKGKRINLITSRLIFDSFLRKAKAITGQNFRNMVNFIEAKPGEKLEHRGATLEFSYSLHSIPCLRFRLLYNGETLGYSGDTRYEPEFFAELERDGVLSSARKASLSNFIFESDTIIHEAGGLPLHTQIPVLSKFPEEVKVRMLVVHTAKIDEATGLRKPLEGKAVELFPEGSLVDASDLDLLAMRTVSLLEEKDLREILVLSRAVKPLTYTKGATILKQGDTGDKMYVISSGKVEVSFKDPQGNETKAAVLGRGDFFGEMALLEPDHVRNASVKALTEVRLLEINKKDFDRYINGGKIQDMITKVKENRPTLSANELFRRLPPRALLKYSAKFTKTTFNKGDIVVKQGGPADKLYVIDSGELDVIDETTNNIIDHRKTGDIFGEIALVKDMPRTATVNVSSESATVLAISKEDFTELLREYPYFEYYLNKVSDKYLKNIETRRNGKAATDQQSDGRGRPSVPGKSPNDAKLVIALSKRVYGDGFTVQDYMKHYEDVVKKYPGLKFESNISESTARRDLQALADRGVLRIRKTKTSHLYSATVEGFHEIRESMALNVVGRLAERPGEAVGSESSAGIVVGRPSGPGKSLDDTMIVIALSGFLDRNFNEADYKKVYEAFVVGHPDLGFEPDISVSAISAYLERLAEIGVLTTVKEGYDLELRRRLDPTCELYKLSFEFSGIDEIKRLYKAIDMNVCLRTLMAIADSNLSEKERFTIDQYMDVCRVASEEDVANNYITARVSLALAVRKHFLEIDGKHYLITAKGNRIIADRNMQRLVSYGLEKFENDDDRFNGWLNDVFVGQLRKIINAAYNGRERSGALWKLIDYLGELSGSMSDKMDASRLAVFYKIRQKIGVVMFFPVSGKDRIIEADAQVSSGQGEVAVSTAGAENADQAVIPKSIKRYSADDRFASTINSFAKNAEMGEISDGKGSVKIQFVNRDDHSEEGWVRVESSNWKTAYVVRKEDRHTWELWINGQVVESKLTSVDIVAYCKGVLLITKKDEYHTSVNAFKIDGNQFQRIPDNILARVVRYEDSSADTYAYEYSSGFSDDGVLSIMTSHNRRIVTMRIRVYRILQLISNATGYKLGRSYDDVKLVIALSDLMDSEGFTVQDYMKSYEDVVKRYPGLRFESNISESTARRDLQGLVDQDVLIIDKTNTAHLYRVAVNGRHEIRKSITMNVGRKNERHGGSGGSESSTGVTGGRPREPGKRSNGEFSVTREHLNLIIDRMSEEMGKGLAGQASSIAMLPAYVGAPTGKEKGDYYYIDVGGSNLRVGGVRLGGGGIYSRIGIQKEAAFTEALKTGNGADLFGFIADKIPEIE
jgi:cAMP-binding proteins - catabolite gene activator and regulatory subunit of cAMP-dependent protein kinases